MKRLTSFTTILFTTALLLVIAPHAAHAQSGAPLTDLLRSTHIHGLAVDRADSGRLLIATHHGLHALQLDTGLVEPVSKRQDDFMGFRPHPTTTTLYASARWESRVYHLVDGGRTWTMLSPGAGGPVDFHQIDVSMANPSVIYGVHGGLQISRDGGRNWSRVGPAPDGLIDLAASSTDTARIYAATQQGLLVSVDGGRVWQPAHPLRSPVSMTEVTKDGSAYAFVLGGGLIRAEDPFLDWRTLNTILGNVTCST